jgi:hypothetical protein
MHERKCSATSIAINLRETFHQIIVQESLEWDCRRQGFSREMREHQKERESIISQARVFFKELRDTPGERSNRLLVDAVGTLRCLRNEERTRQRAVCKAVTSSGSHQRLFAAIF